MQTRPLAIGGSLLLLWIGACQRPEGSATAPAASPSAVSPPPELPACVWPLAVTPARAAPPAASCPPSPTSPAPLPRTGLRFLDAPEAPRLEVELAVTPASRERGLMYRTELAAHAGMLFAWPREEIRSFWMRNTCIPLDMLFLDQKSRIVGIVEQVPTLNEASRSVPCPAAYVLEVNAGFCRRYGIRPGQRVEIELPN